MTKPEQITILTYPTFDDNTDNMNLITQKARQ